MTCSTIFPIFFTVAFVALPCAAAPDAAQSSAALTGVVNEDDIRLSLSGITVEQDEGELRLAMGSRNDADSSLLAVQRDDDRYRDDGRYRDDRYREDDRSYDDDQDFDDDRPRRKRKINFNNPVPG